MPYPAVNLKNVKTIPLPKRKNRVGEGDFIFPDSPYEVLESTDLAEVAQRILAARDKGAPVMWMQGAHVIKCGLSPIVIRLLEDGFIQHISSNGAATIHDFEIALLGGTSEDVADSLKDGSFGMAEETGRMMNLAIQAGIRCGKGIGESLGELIGTDPRFETHRNRSVLYNAWRLGIPYTVHVAIGTDIIHQHPMVDFAAIGKASGQDFKIFVKSLCGLEGGVFLNFGSAVIGPEVFLKALSIGRNLGNPLRVFTTANFDLINLGDYRCSVGMDNPDYYYRPRKNIVNRPVMLGGKGFHICGDHKQTIPTLYHLLTKGGKIYPVVSKQLNNESGLTVTVQDILDQDLRAHPEIAEQRQSILSAFFAIQQSFLAGGTLFTAGNGGSMSDALHISGELLKSFCIKRHVPRYVKEKLSLYDDGQALAESLEPAQRVVVLGQNSVLRSAVDNDFPHPQMAIAQELYAMAKPGDVLFSISTSGNAKNLHHSAHIAHVLGLTVIGLTGQKGGLLREDADILIAADAGVTDEIQDRHILIYHVLCKMLEAAFFDEDREK